MLRPDAQAARVDPRGEVPRVEAAFGGRWLAWAWRDRLNGAALAVSVAALAALAMTLVMPRGPVTTGQALAAMAVGLGVGLSAGFLLRSRWAAPAALPAFALVFELRWIGPDGPTVDAPTLDSAYGILALLLGRGFFALVGLLPMLLGVSLGAAAARRLRGSAAAPSRASTRVWLYVRRASTAVVAVGLIALAVLIARPASTAAIVGPDGESLAGSIARLEKVELGGAEQWLLIRGHSVDKPV